MKFSILLITIMASVSQTARADENVIAVLETTKQSYVQGEPIELRLAVINRTREKILIYVSYPSFASNGTGVKISPVANPSASHSAYSEQDAPSAWRKFSIFPSNAGETWSLKIYLQRFIRDLSPGTHELRYSVRIGCATADGQTNIIANGEGVLRVVVLNANPGALADAISVYARKLEASNYWDRRGAEEALSVTESPVVIPYLVRTMALGTTDSMVGALARFKGNTDAKNLLLRTARDGQPVQSIRALVVLREWNELIHEDDLGHILNRNNQSLKLAALQYADKMDGSAYIPAILASVDDSDQLVAKEARRVAQALRDRLK